MAGAYFCNDCDYGGTYDAVVKHCIEVCNHWLPEMYVICLEDSDEADGMGEFEDETHYG